MDVKQFLTRAANEGHSWDVEALMSLANGQGMRFTADELSTAADELWGDLSEDQLRGVVGGGFPHPNPPPGKLPPGTYWSPPPGDVSGNSCFFMRPR